MYERFKGKTMDIYHMQSDYFRCVLKLVDNNL